MTAQPPRRYDIPAQARAVVCRGQDCGRWIVFVELEGGKRMPVEAAGEHKGEPHWAHCPASKDFKGKGQRTLFGGDS